MVRGGMSVARRQLAVAFAAMALGACARETARPDKHPANRGDASWHAVEQPDTVHYQLALGEVSSGGKPLARVTPAYPASRLQACVPVVDVIAKLIVDTSGKVTEVRPGNADAAAPGLRPFLAATREAALRWRFDPLQIDHWSADANGGSHVVDSRTEPFSLDYVFRFICHSGRARVSVGDQAAAG